MRQQNTINQHPELWSLLDWTYAGTDITDKSYKQTSKGLQVNPTHTRNSYTKLKEQQQYCYTNSTILHIRKLMGKRKTFICLN